MPVYNFPTSAQLTTVDPVVVAAMELTDPIFGEFPIVGSNDSEIVWEQRDNYTGLMNFRGYDGEPKLVKRVGSKRYRMAPGVYGEFVVIREEEMTRRAAFGSWADVVDVSDLVTMGRDQLLVRQINRIRWILWTLATTGRFIVLDEFGAIADTGSIALRTYTAPVLWSTTATAAPLADFRAVKLYGRGQSASFGSGSVAVMNQKTANYLFANTNQNDLAGKRAEGLATVDGLGPTNRILSREDMPQILIFDDGYQDDNDVFQPFVPDGKVVLFGRRANGAKLGEFRYTLSRVSMAGQSQPYVRVVPKGMRDDEAPPPSIEVHRGFNGGPVVYYPGSITVMTVA